MDPIKAFDVSSHLITFLVNESTGRTKLSGPRAFKQMFKIKMMSIAPLSHFNRSNKLLFIIFELYFYVIIVHANKNIPRFSDIENGGAK